MVVFSKPGRKAHRLVLILVLHPRCLFAPRWAGHGPQQITSRPPPPLSWPKQNTKEMPHSVAEQASTSSHLRRGEILRRGSSSSRSSCSSGGGRLQIKTVVRSTTDPTVGVFVIFVRLLLQLHSQLLALDLQQAWTHFTACPGPGVGASGSHCGSGSGCSCSFLSTRRADKTR